MRELFKPEREAEFNRRAAESEREAIYPLPPGSIASHHEKKDSNSKLR